MDDAVFACIECGAPVQWSPGDRRWAILSTTASATTEPAESPKGDGWRRWFRPGPPQPEGDPICEECESADHFVVLDYMDGELDDHLS